MVNKGPVRDKLNRVGIQLEITRTIPGSKGTTMRTSLIIDQSTARILQIEIGTGGQVLPPIVYVDSGYVHAIGQTLSN